MVSRPELGSDSLIGSDREPGVTSRHTILCFGTRYIILTLISKWCKEQCLPNVHLDGEVHNIFHITFILVRTLSFIY